MFTKQIELARRYANKAHQNQKYGEEFSYLVHLTYADSVLIRFGFVKDERLRTGIYLHDVVEDTERDISELVSFFGQDVADDVAALSEPKEGTRKEKHAITYPKIATRPHSCILKLADRIANVEFSGRKVGMYKKEHQEFKNWVYGRGQAVDKTKVSEMEHHLNLLLSEL